MRERHRDKPCDGRLPKKCLLIGADEPVGKYLADYLYDQNFDVERVGGKLIFASKEGLKQYDYIIMVADYVWCDGLTEARRDTIEHLQKVTRIIQMCPTRVRFIYIVPHYLPERWKAVEKAFRKSGREYISLHVPEIVYKDIDAGWLPRLLKNMQAGRPVRIDDMAKEKDFLWLADLGYFVEKLMDGGVWQERSLELTAYRRANNELIVRYSGVNLQLSEVDVTLSYNDGYVCPPLNGEKAVKSGFSSMGVLSMVKRLLPPAIGDGLGMVGAWFREGERQEWIQEITESLKEAQGYVLDDAVCEEGYRMLRKRYDKVQVYTIVADGIGYFCFNLYLQAFEIKEGNILHLFVPVYKMGYKTASFANSWLWQHCLRSDRDNIIYLTKENSAFWRYIMRRHGEYMELCRDYTPLEVIRREMEYRHIPFAKNFIIDFTDDEHREGEKKLQEMGIHGKDYVCFMVRDNAYNKAHKGANRPEEFEHNDRSRNADIEKYRSAFAKLGQRNICSVRMGAAVDKKFTGEKIIDYAGEYRTEMMDFYLLANCKFFIGTCTGIIGMAMLFRRPMVMTNYINFMTNMDHHPPLTYERDLFIPKKIWHTKEQRYLTLREMLDLSFRYNTWRFSMDYEALGYEICENTPEEIEDVIMEMENRLEGRRIYTEEEEAMQANYRDILMDAVERSNFHYTDARCGTEFLKKNPWFLN